VVSVGTSDAKPQLSDVWLGARSPRSRKMGEGRGTSVPLVCPLPAQHAGKEVGTENPTVVVMRGLVAEGAV
jgi:hypothetical protein